MGYGNQTISNGYFRRDFYSIDSKIFVCMEFHICKRCNIKIVKNTYPNFLAAHKQYIHSIKKRCVKLFECMARSSFLMQDMIAALLRLNIKINLLFFLKK